MVCQKWTSSQVQLRRDLVAEIFFDRIVVSTPCADAQQQWDLELREDVPLVQGPGRTW